MWGVYICVCVPRNAYCIKLLTFVVVTLGLFFTSNNGNNNNYNYNRKSRKKNKIILKQKKTQQSTFRKRSLHCRKAIFIRPNCSLLKKTKKTHSHTKYKRGVYHTTQHKTFLKYSIKFLRI